MYLIQDSPTYHGRRAAGTFSKEGGQERNRRGSTAIFLTFPAPIWEFAHPRFTVLSGQKRIVAHPIHKCKMRIVELSYFAQNLR